MVKIKRDQVSYVKGEESIFTIDSDLMYYFELMDIMKDIGYLNNPIIYYNLSNSNMNTGLVALASDTNYWDC